MSNVDIVLVIFCCAAVFGLLLRWGWLPECKGDDALLKYYRGDDLKDKP